MIKHNENHIGYFHLKWDLNHQTIISANARWLNEIKELRNQRYEIILSSMSIHASNEKMTLEMTLVTPSLREVKLASEFNIVDVEDGVVTLVEKKFDVRRSSNIEVHTQNLKGEYVEKIIDLSHQLITFFSKKWTWNKNESVIVKIYDDYQSCSFSVPDIAVYGWYEYREPIKISFPTYLEKAAHLEFVQAVLKHEFAHQVLSELTNDNAALFLQEGFALYNENLIDSNANDIVEKELSLEIFISKILAETPDRLTLQEVIDLEYTSGLVIYHQGLLWTSFLIEAFPKRYFHDLLRRLSNQEYMDCRTAQKYNRNNHLNFDVITEVYGKEDVLNKKFLDYYSTNVKLT